MKEKIDGQAARATRLAPSAALSPLMVRWAIGMLGIEEISGKADNPIILG